MSNKRQLKMSPNRRVTFTLCCDLSQKRRRKVFVVNFVSILLILLLTSTALIVESAKLETETKTESTTTIKIATNNYNERHIVFNNNDNKNILLHHNHLEEAAENFYHSELQRLSYDTIHSILRDEKKTHFRREDMDRRYYHTKSLQPTHEVMKRDANEEKHFINLKAKKLTEFNFDNNKTFKSIYPKFITDIDLSLNQLQTVNLTIFENLLTLNLSNNQLKEIPITESSTIVIIDLNSNHIQTTQLPTNKHLKALYLRDNQIENLAALNLSQLTELEILDLSCNRIKNLETSFFPQLMHNLKFLNLAHNHLESISQETFYNLLSLNTLLLAFNNISYIDYETFLSLPNLQYLDLSYNQLKGESIGALQGIPYMENLSIAYNPDVGESLQEFVASWSLKEVDASGTKLCQIPAALAQAVRTLKLADNWFKIINCGDLDSYPLLQHLDLSNSNINDIEDDALGRLEVLELLFLDHNRLRKVPVSLPISLEHLFLQNNEIMDLQVQAFQSLKNLKTLDLSHNKLLYLPALSLPKLLTLNLQSSGLQGLNQAIVHTLPHLRDLYLEENPIKCSDLLGIAEWASPCRIAERGGTTAKSTDSGQIGNADVGQQRQQQLQLQQTVATKIDLKRKFVQTYNFYEKSGISVGVSNCNCVNIESRQMHTVTSAVIPPTCAIELKEQETLLKVKKPTMHTEIDTKLVEQQWKEKHQQQQNKTNVNFNERQQVTEPEKKSTIFPNHINATTLGITENVNHTKSNNETFQTKNFLITNVTSVRRPLVTDVGTTIIQNQHSPINSLEKMQQTTEITTSTTTTAFIPTTSLLRTPSALNKSTKVGKNFVILMPTQAMPKTSATKITQATAIATHATMSNYVDLNSTRAGLLERERRLKGYEQTTIAMATPETTLESLLSSAVALTTTTTLISHQAQNLARNTGTNGNQKMLSPQRKSSNNIENLNGETKDNATGKFQKENLPNTIQTTATAPQHKHVTLQLNIKDRHLIGTPLLTHHGETLMVAAEELMKTGNHISAKPTIPAEIITKTTTTVAPAASVIQKQQQRLAESQKQDQLPEQKVNKFTKSHDAENVAITTTTMPEKLNELKTTTAMHASITFNNRTHNNEQKRKPTLIMKKMTITTKHGTSASTPKENDDDEKSKQQSQPQLQHQKHYTLNIPRNNEITSPEISLKNEDQLNSNNQYTTAQQQHNTNNNNIKHHSTVNTPIIYDHKNEPQTFQEHDEMEAAAAAAVAARASTSAQFNSKLHQHNTETAAQRLRSHFDNPTIVFLAGIGLFVTLVLSLLHVYRCRMPNILWLQRQQLRRPHREEQGQQLHLRHSNQNYVNDEGHSFLNNSINNQFQRAQINQQQEKSHHSHPHIQQLQQSQQQKSSPFHNLQVRELQQTSSIEHCPKYCKSSYNISSALGERSSSHTSSSCSPHSSCTFDDESCYIEMTTDVGQPVATTTSCSISHSDLLPMELLNKTKLHNFFDEVDAHHLQAASTSINLHGHQPSPLDENSIEESNTKLTPGTRKLGIW